MENLTYFSRRKIIFFVSFWYLATVSAQVLNKNIVEQNRIIAGFNSINVDDGIDVYIAPGESTSVKVIADDYLISKLKTELNGQELIIKMDGTYLKPDKLEVHLELPILKGITAKGSSDVFSTGSFQLDEFYIRLGEGSDLCLKLIAQKLRCDLSGGSDAHLNGKAEHLSGNISGGSILKASGLEVQNCKLEAITGSDAYIRVIGDLEIEANEASGIYFQGTPNILYQKASSNSDIRAVKQNKK